MEKNREFYLQEMQVNDQDTLEQIGQILAKYNEEQIKNEELRRDLETIKSFIHTTSIMREKYKSEMEEIEKLMNA